MMNGQQYKDSLRDGRKIYFEGERIDDLPSQPIMGDCVDRVAGEYDRLYDPDIDARSPLTNIPRSADDLRNQIPLLHASGMMAHVTYTSIMTLTTAAGRLADVAPEAVERIQAYVDDAQKRDIRITQCITDSKGDRSRSPGKQDDPDAYVHVVDRSREGVVIRGAKLHITGASLGHDLMTIPTKAMKPGEEDYAIACLVPVNAPGRLLRRLAPGHQHPGRRRPVRPADRDPQALRPGGGQGAGRAAVNGQRHAVAETGVVPEDVQD